MRRVSQSKNMNSLFDDLPDIINFERRNVFQKEHSAEEIKAIELKFYDMNLRGSYSEHCARALTPDEREVYAQYLESKGQLLGAASFRNYSPEQIEKEKTEEKLREKKQRENR